MSIRQLDDVKNLLLCNRKCSECLFSPNSIVPDDLRGDFIEHYREECQANDGTAFECHFGTAIGKSVKCRGFYEANAGNLLFHLARALDRMVEIDTAELEREAASTVREKYPIDESGKWR